MFRLIKLAIYGFVFYSLYQLYQGIMQQQQGGGGGMGGGMGGGAFPASRTQDYNAGLSESGSTGQNLTGAGAGHAEETLDNDGGSVRHSVGRGVIST
jgi:hypothetical protein